VLWSPLRGKEELKHFSSLKPWSVPSDMEFLLPCCEGAGVRGLTESF